MSAHTQFPAVVTGQVVPEGQEMPAPILRFRVETPELCAKGHRMIFTEFRDALVFVMTNSPPSRNGPGGLSCRNCWFKFAQPDDKVFICETCTQTNSGTSCCMSKKRYGHGGCQDAAAEGLMQAGPTVYCETCVAVKGANLHRHTGQWADKFFDCSNDTRSLVDSTLCFPCVFGSLCAFMHQREDGEVAGGNARQCATFGMCLTVYLWDTVGYGLCIPSTVYTCALQQHAARLDNIEPLGVCAGFWQAFWCRPCVLARVHRHYSARSEDLGQPNGCLYNYKAEPAVKRPHVAYNAAPVPPPAMSQEKSKSSPALVDSPRSQGSDEASPLLE